MVWRGEGREGVKRRKEGRKKKTKGSGCGSGEGYEERE